VAAEPAERDPARRSELPPFPASGEPTLVTYAWSVVTGWPTVLGVTAIALGLGAFYLFAATPIYHSDAVVQIEQKPSLVPGLEQLLGQSISGPAETEMAIIRSRSALSQVVEELGLDLSIAPRRFPLVGGALARRHAGPGPAPAWFGLASYAWGGERLKVLRLDLSDDLLDVPLRLTAGEGARFRIDAGGEPLVEGEVGTVASAEREGRRVEVLVSELVARPGTEFRVTRHRRSLLVAALQRRIRIAEDGRASGVLVISLDGADPARIAAVLDAVARSYVRQNVDRKSAEAAQQLGFLETQLPIVKEQVSAAEAALNRFMKTHGAVNLSAEAQSVLERAASIERELSALDLQASELRQRFTAQHPAFASLNEKIHTLRAERASINARMQTMPEVEADSSRLQRDLRVSRELFDLLSNRAQELRIVKSGAVGNVRLVDSAYVPLRPAWPRPAAVLSLTAFLGVLGGIGAALVRKALAQGAEDGEEIEASTGMPVLATVTHARAQDAIARGDRGRRSGRARILAAEDPQDPAVESLRSLRTSLQFVLVEAPNSVISISGPAPGVGKTFVCVNLAYVLASPEGRVLLVDGDLRRGRLHRCFDLARRPGLSDLLSDSASLSAAIRPTGNPAVDVLPTGNIPPNPVELLSSHRFRALVEKLGRTYAYVLVDTPPALAVTDATVVARLAGVNLLVLRAGQHSIREIALCLKRFSQGGGVVQGAVLNDVRPTAGRYGKHGRYQRYEYRSEGA
jgi:tyrosine-protein kinase Etk/Wzc